MRKGPFAWLGIGWLVVGLLGLASCQTVPGPPPPPWADPARIGSDLAWLTAPERQGRGLGSRGLAETAEWLAGGFEAAGLRPGGDGGFLQPFETIVRIEHAGSRLEAHGLDLQSGRDFAPMSISESGPFEGELVFAGYGISTPDGSHDDYAGLEVEDRIVLVLDGRPETGPLQGRRGVPFLERRSKIVSARSRGARGILFAPDRGEVEFRDPHGVDPKSKPAGLFALRISQATARSLVDAAGPRLASLRERARAGHTAAAELGVRVRGEVEIERVRDTVANVVGWVPGSDPGLAGEAVVIGAHFDHLGLGRFGSLSPDRRGEIHPGADDNASGTAALLALARALSSAPPPARSVVLVGFTAEEAGLLGSAHFVDHLPEGLPKPVAMLNMDMIGRLRDDRVVVFGAESADEWPMLLEEDAAALGLRLAHEGGGPGPSDQTSFYVKELPVLHFFTGTHSAYHTAEDRLDTVDPQGISRVAQLVLAVARGVADAPKRFAFRGRPAEAHAGAGTSSGYGPDLGTIPAFGGEPVVGVRLAGVRPDSPAARAGLRAGDVLVSFGGTEIRDLADFAALLFAERAGREVELGVIRGGQRIDTRATLGARR